MYCFILNFTSPLSYYIPTHKDRGARGLHMAPQQVLELRLKMKFLFESRTDVLSYFNVANKKCAGQLGNYPALRKWITTLRPTWANQ